MNNKKRADFIKRAERWHINQSHERELTDYQPFFTVRDVPSLGRCHRIPSWSIGRLHHLFSDLEASVFYVADYSSAIIDIREQYPLMPVEETIAISDEIGVRHPAHDGRIHVMSTDLLLTRSGGKLDPVCIKLSSEFEIQRTREKLEIERVYWARRGLQLRFVTEKQISRPLVRAVAWVHAYREPEGLHVGHYPIEQVIQGLDGLFEHDRSLPLSVAGRHLDSDFGLSPGRTLAVARHAIARRHWRLDLRRGIDTLQPLPWMAEVSNK